MAGQNDYTGLIVVAGVAGLAWYGYEQGWFAGLFPTSTIPAAGSSAATLPTGVNAIPTNVMSMAVQITFANAALAAGLSIAEINSTLQSYATNYSFAPNCASGSQWIPFTNGANGNISGGGCIGGLVPSSPSTTPVSITIPTAVPLSDTLQQAAGSSATTLDADQWSYYWDQIGQTPISPAQFGAIFFPTGRPASQSDYPQYNVAQFLQALQNGGISISGLSGLGNYEGIPMGAIHGGW